MSEQAKTPGERTVLILEDDPNVLRFYGDGLNASNVRVVACREIEAAECLMGEQRFDVVITDLNVSELGGLEGLRLVRSFKTHFPDTHVVVVSGCVDDHVRRMALGFGASEVLSKPVDLERLRDLVHRTDLGAARRPPHRARDSRVRVVEPLDKVLVGKRISAVLQPIYSLLGPLAGREVHGAEILARGPKGSVLHDPALLFAYASRKEKLFETDLLCLEAGFSESCLLPQTVKLFVNIQPRSMTRPAFAASLGALARRAGLDEDRIVVEITEQQTIVNPKAFAATVSKLRAQGFRIALDDYGSGFSNLQLVLDLRPDYLKIDGEFCEGIDRDRRRKAIVRSTVAMATDLGVETIVERVETRAEFETVRALGAHYAQGFYLAHPASGAETARTIGRMREAVG